MPESRSVSDRTLRDAVWNEVHDALHIDVEQVSSGYVDAAVNCVMAASDVEGDRLRAERDAARNGRQGADAAVRVLEADVERLREENDKLRAALQDLADKWPWVSAALDEGEETR